MAKKDFLYNYSFMFTIVLYISEPFLHMQPPLYYACMRMYYVLV